MSHELRTPLNAIIGYSDMLHEEVSEQGEEQLAEDLNHIRTAGRALLNMISDILDISKIEAGKMFINLEETDPKKIIEMVLPSIQPQLLQNQNKLVFHCPPELPHRYTDPVKLQQIFLNLLSNATKFTHDGEISLTCTPHTDAKGEWLIFTIADTGIGMTPSQVKIVFEAFTQADSSISRRYGGTGLGLAICYHFCQMLGGDIQVESEVGKGTTFTITLPIRTEPKVQSVLMT
jgi:signal transduction histidine kinase